MAVGVWRQACGGRCMAVYEVCGCGMRVEVTCSSHSTPPPHLISSPPQHGCPVALPDLSHPIPPPHTSPHPATSHLTPPHLHSLSGCFGGGCVPCERGTFQDSLHEAPADGEHDTCIACPDGKFQNSTGSTACSGCSKPFCSVSAVCNKCVYRETWWLGGGSGGWDWVDVIGMGCVGAPPYG